MNIQASRLLSALAPPASAAPTRLAAASALAATPATGASSGADTVTISQAAKDLLAQSQASVSLSSRAMDLIQRRNPFDAAPGTGNPQAEVHKVMDSLTTQHNNKQMSTTQYQHDMAFYTRVSNAIG
ncbi:MAG: hypothetical protein H7172_01265 [Ferruginibacter sp.]|nr:hypothetical protein [Rhodoferax sp.]